MAIAEPTRVVCVAEDRKTVLLNYPDNNHPGWNNWVPISEAGVEKIEDRKEPYKEVNSMFMLGDFARNYIYVSNWHEEPLQDISAEDCKNEGIQVFEGDRLCLPGESEMVNAIYRDQFAKLWNSIHKAPGTSWGDDPKVTVYSYRYLGNSQIPF